jgi:predicted transcriptional regulator
VIRTEEEHLEHYGILRRSGRYPYGSGKEGASKYPWGTGSENTRHRTFLDTIAAQKKSGMTDAQIAKSWGFSRNDLTAARTIALAQQKRGKILQAQRLRDKGWSKVAIGQRMGLPESSVRALLKEGELDKVEAYESIANMLKSQVDKKSYIDIGKGVEHHVGVTRNRLDTAVAMLKEQGYTEHTIYIQQANLPGHYTPLKVLAKPGTKKSEVERNRGQIKQITDRSEDNGRSFLDLKPPLSISSKRIAINYGPDGGKEADGVIYVRRGVKDIQIGSKNYGQVRIAVDNSHYLKGMAVYKDDMPPGVDLIFNTNKPNTGNKHDVMKPLNLKDPENPFGSMYTQVQENGKVTSAMNLVNEEGQWDTWSKNLSSQMLSKQSPSLAKQQLDLTYDRRRKDYDEIKSLTNPIVRKQLLIQFGDATDSAAVHLKAANIPRQATKVILPINSIKPGEVYNPGMKNGDRVALVRHPHGGTFEIPLLTVNNKNPEAKKILGNARDAIGIHHSVAQRLSGADFDGDTVLVIPNNNKQITSTPALEGLKHFDPMSYALPKGSPIPPITSAQKQTEMGKISNLITDMTLQGAKSDELASAIRHSMVVIDSEKHNLDFRQSAVDHRIRSLKEKYQGRSNAGARTLISRAGASPRRPELRLRSAREGGPIDPKTGKRVLVPTGRMRVETKMVRDPVTGRKTWVKTGRTVPIMGRRELLSITDDAFSLVDPPGFEMEKLYATHSNRLKAMANSARKDALQIKPPPADKVAKRLYHPEVESLNHKLRRAEYNAPLERQAQLITNTYVSQVKRNNPDLDPDDITKIKMQALRVARARTGVEKHKIIINPSEWNAIQAGAIAPTKLEKILTHSDLDVVRALALPKQTKLLSANDLRRAQTMKDRGYTQAEIAEQLGVGLTTLKVGLSE